MKTLLWILALFSLAVGLTMFAQLNTGYALLFLPPWRIELSLNVFAVVLICVLAALYITVQILVEVLGLPARVRRYNDRKAAEASVQLEREARIAFFEGRFQRAERLAAEALEASRDQDAIAVNGLLAARSAHAMRDFERRDEHFKTLQDKLGYNHLATLMTMGELYLDERRYTEAGQAIQAARSISPKLTAALKLELRLRQRERNPEAVLRLVEQLAKSKAVDSDQAGHIRIAALQQQLRQHPMTARELKDWWRKLDADDRTSPQLAAAVASQWASQNEWQFAREILEKALDAHWDGELVTAYGQLELQGDELTTQLQQAENWLQNHPDDPLLLLTLGRLCRQRELWGKAQTYLEASIALAPSAQAHAELAALLDQLEQNEAASQHYRTSLSLALR